MPNYVVWLLYVALAVPVFLFFGWGGLIGYGVTMIILEIVMHFVAKSIK